MHPKPWSGRQASPTRVSRRQQGLQPEFGLLPVKVKNEDVVTATIINAGAMTSSTKTAVVLQQPRMHPSFHGSPSEDPEDMLEQVERVRLFNHWDDEMTFRQVFFYLEDSAQIWFEDHESSLEFWNKFSVQFLTMFSSFLR